MPDQPTKKHSYNLLVSYRTPCEGKIHTVSVHRNGQLVFHDHQRGEIQRELRFAKLGGQPCRCAEIAHMYASNQFDQEVPKEFIRERPAGDRNTILVWRLWRRRARKRGPDKCLSNVDDQRYSVVEADDPPRALVQHVKMVLNERGYQTSSARRTVCIVTDCKKADADFPYKHELTAFVSPRHNIGIIVGSQEFIISMEECRQPPLRFLADLCERQYLKTMLFRACKRSETRNDRVSELAELKEAIPGITDKFNGLETDEFVRLRVDPNDLPWTVSFYMDSLEKQRSVHTNGIIKATIRKMVSEITRTKNKVERLMAAAKKRLQSAR